MADIVKDLCNIERAMTFIAASSSGEVKTELLELAERLSRLCVDASLTVEALNPVFEIDGPRGGYLSMMDLAYNAFMIGRNMESRDDGTRASWLEHCHPLMQAGVSRIHKDVVERMEYARQNTRRQIERSIENVSSGLTTEQAEAGAACLYGHLDRDFSGGEKVSYPQASEHTKGKYRRAFASATVESNLMKEAA